MTRSVILTGFVIASANLGKQCITSFYTEWCVEVLQVFVQSKSINSRTPEIETATVFQCNVGLNLSQFRVIFYIIKTQTQQPKNN